MDDETMRNLFLAHCMGGPIHLGAATGSTADRRPHPHIARYAPVRMMRAYMRAAGLNGLLGGRGRRQPRLGRSHLPAASVSSTCTKGAQ